MRESWNFFAQYPKPIKNYKIRKSSFFLQKVFWTLTMQFWQALLKIFDWSPKTFRSMSKNDKEFFEKKFSFQMSYRTGRIQFSQPSWKKFVRKLESFRHMIHKLSLNVQNWFFKKFFWSIKQFTWKCSHRHVESSSDNHVQKVCKRAKEFALCPKMIKEKSNYFSELKFSLQSVPVNK